MNIYKFAPKAVVNSLSVNARNIIESRIADNVLKPYYHLDYNIRIRGLKPSVLYSKYSTLNENNELVTMYVTSAEEEQSEWVHQLVMNIKSNKTQESRIDIFLRAMTEMSWCTWEDRFMYGTPTLPQEHLSGYKDYLNNTFFHCVSYACANRVPVDINDIELQLQALKFTENADLYATNNLGETPLKILMQNEELFPYVESLLLRLPQNRRLEAVSFQYWSKTWTVLISTIIDDHTQLAKLIQQTRKERGFLALYMYMTCNSPEALRALFRANYKLLPHHHYNDKFTQEQATLIEATIIENPDWYNLTVWAYTIAANKNSQFKKIKPYLQVRNCIIAHEISLKAHKNIVPMMDM